MKAGSEFIIRIANGGLAVCPVESNAASRQPDDVGRFDESMAVTSERMVQVVYGNKQHVSLFLRVVAVETCSLCKCRYTGGGCHF